MNTVVIVGSRHNLEYRDLDKNLSGKKQIYSILDKFKPEAVFIECGYNEQFLCPKREKEKPHIRDHWASEWCSDNNIKVTPVDLEECINDSSILKERREEAISYAVIKNRTSFLLAVLFTGKDHVDNIKDKIKKAGLETIIQELIL